MSMSTDGAPIKPVYFLAEDKETFTHLRINDFDKPFPVTPRDGRKPCKTLIVTVARKLVLIFITLFIIVCVHCKGFKRRGQIKLILI